MLDMEVARKVVFKMNAARVYAFGDSLVTGTYALQGGWCDQLKRDLHRITNEATDGTKFQMYNLGIGGETSSGLTVRLATELVTRHRVSWPAVVIIGTGKNDSRLTDGQPEVSVEEYEANLDYCIDLARELTDKIILVGLGPCAEEEIKFKQYTYSRQRLVQYDTVMTKVANRQAAIKVDVYQSLLAAEADVFYRDGLHLNDAGYDIIYNAVKPVLLNFLSR